MEIETTRGDRVTVIAPKGKLTIGEPVESFEEAVVDLVDSGVRFLVIDLSNVSRLDSSGVGSLVSALRNCRDQHGDARLAGPSGHLSKILEMMGLMQVFEVHETVEGAKSSLARVEG